MPSLYVRLSKFLHSLHLVFLLTSFPLIKKTPFRWYQSFWFSILSPFILITLHGGLFIKETLNIQNYSIKREMPKLPSDVISLLYSMLIASFSSKVLRLCIAPIFNPHIAIFFSKHEFCPCVDNAIVNSHLNISSLFNSNIATLKSYPDQ